MFDIAAVLLAAALRLTAHKSYRNIAFVLFLWLAVSHLSYTCLLLELREANNWVIYQIYNVINCGVIYALSRLNAHMLAIYMLALNILLNIAVSFYFISDIVPIIVYNSYSYVAGGIVVIILGYMRLLNGNRLIRRENNHPNIISVFFLSRVGRGKLFFYGRAS